METSLERLSRAWLAGRLSYCFVALVGLLLLPNCVGYAQESSESGAPVLHGSSSAGVGSAGVDGTVGGGGGAGADFTELMNLIQQTIDPDSWVDQTSSMVPFPSGVFVASAQQAQRIAIDASLQIPAVMTGSTNMPRAPWRKSSRLRSVSLRQVDQALQASRSQGLQLPQELLQLAGLLRIEFVQIDVPNEDILIAGPADAGQYCVRLDDLALIAYLTTARSGSLGCSIDPTNPGLVAAQDLMRSPTAHKRLGIDPQKFSQQLLDAIGDHRVSVFGMKNGSSTAQALIDADVHMKQVGFGVSPTAAAIETYFDHLDRLAKVPPQSLIRWWFAYADQPVRTSASRELFQLPDNCVAVLSEQQWASQLGRTPTGGIDPAAEAFSSSFTNHLAELRRELPAYARLHAVFESALAFQVGLQASGQSSFKAWFPNLCQHGQILDQPSEEPPTVTGLAAWHKLKNGSVVAVVSGGVQVDAIASAKPKNWQETVFAFALSSPPRKVPTTHGSWWWD